MRLYSLTGASSASHPEHGDHEVDPETGAVEVPHLLGEILHDIHIAGKRIWETDAERTARELDEDLARRKDPATLLAAVEKLAAEVAAGRHEAPEQPSDDAAAKAAAEAAAAAAKKAADDAAAKKKAAGS